MKNKDRIKGIITALITPMDEEERINEVELRAQVNRLIEAGVHGIFCCGTNGEGFILTAKEKERILSVVVEETRGRVPVYAGTGDISTKETVRQSVRAQELGADALSVITPWFVKATQEELYEHYRSVAQAVDLPVVLYNIPARTGNALEPATVKRLSEIDNIAGVKDSSGNFQNILAYLAATQGQDFAVLSGDDSLILWTLMAGGTGGVSGCSNVYPKLVAGIYEAFTKGEMEQARACQEGLRPFIEALSYGNSNTMVKEAVRLLGYPVGHCRRPFDLIPQEGLAALQKVLEENRKSEGAV